jgi:hypothetical protein
MRLIWEDGTMISHPLTRQVFPHVRATPSTLVIGSLNRDQNSKVVIQSDGLPFRILSVNRPSVVKSIDFRQDALATHVLTLQLDAAGFDRSKSPEIEILTDHPAQKSVKIKIFLVDHEKGDAS